MKRIVCLLISLLLVLNIAYAIASEPGETVTVTISVSGNPNAAISARVGFSFDSSVFEFVKATKSSSDVMKFPSSASEQFGLLNMSGLSTGSIGTITLRIKENAPAGVYSISTSADSVYDGDRNSVALYVSGGSVTVTSNTPTCTSHTWNNGEVETEATCASEGVMRYTCTNSGCSATKTESIPKLTTHTWDSGKVTTAATCTKDGVKTYTCTVCKKTEDKTIPAARHDDGEWVVATEATCKADGLKELRCTKCEAVLETEVIPAANVEHIPSDMIATTPADCTNAGEKTQKCTLCSEVLATEEIPAEGHDDGKWAVATEATCKADGLKELCCTKCEAVLETEVIPAANVDHIPGDIIETTPADCTNAGEKTQKCTLCGEVLATEEIPAEGHDEGKWGVVKPATDTEVGLQELRCTKCDEVLDSAEIPVNTTGYYVRNTVCSMGPRFKDESALTDKWYRFTPVDLSVDGVQTYELIGSDVNIIGYITVTVADGTVTIDCSYVSDEVKVHSEFCTILPSLAETTALDQAQLKNYAFGETISIADELGGDTKVLLFICNVVDYNTDMPITRIWPNTNDFMLKINALKENMD